MPEVDELKKRLGWHKDPADFRDFKPALAAVETIPRRHIWDKFVVPVEEQKGSSCVGFGIGGNLSTYAFRYGVPVPGTTRFSETDIYNGARFIEGNLSRDDGCYPRDAFKWLQQKSCLPYKYWEHKGFEKCSRPSSLDQYAIPYPLTEFYRVTGGVDGICAVIAQGLGSDPTLGFCVSIGTPWPDDWMKAKNGDLSKIKESTYVEAGHETYTYGYDLDEQYFYCQNSWGTDWGNKGRFRMPFQAFAVFRAWGGYDAHWFKVNWVKQPEPSPEPTPVPKPTTFAVRHQVSTDNGKTWETTNSVIK
jgi:hypothetical protein